LPLIVHVLSLSQLQQVQKVLDAAVVNPEVEREGNLLWQQSVTHQIGNQVNRDPRIVDQANRVFQTKILIDDRDKHIKLDFDRLLAPGALLPRTDNPDEAMYLIKVRQALEKYGVWLRIDHKWHRDPNEYTRVIFDDPRSFQAWLEFGYDGHPINAPAGLLTREAILSAVWIGEGYWSEVYKGKFQTALDSAIRGVRSQISTGETLHDMQQEARDSARIGVVWVSDRLGGAVFPGTKIWDLPHELVEKALKQNVGGNISQSCDTIMYAAIATAMAARILNEYIDATIRGAQQAVTALTVAKVSGMIADSLLLVRGLIRVLATWGAAEVGVTAATSKSAPRIANSQSSAAYARTVNNSPAAHANTVNQSNSVLHDTNLRHQVAFERTVNQAGITLDTGAGAADFINRYDIAIQQRIRGWHDGFMTALEEAYKAKGRTWVYMTEFQEIAAKVTAKWGDPRIYL